MRDEENSRRIGILNSMGVPPEKQGTLYWWQERSLMREYYNKKKFQAQLSGAKIR